MLIQRQDAKHARERGITGSNVINVVRCSVAMETVRELAASYGQKPVGVCQRPNEKFTSVTHNAKVFYRNCKGPDLDDSVIKQSN